MYFNFVEFDDIDTVVKILLRNNIEPNKIKIVPQVLTLQNKDQTYNYEVLYMVEFILPKSKKEKQKENKDLEDFGIQNPIK